MWFSRLLGSALVVLIFLHIAEGYTVINENGCSKVLRQRHQNLVEARKEDITDVGYQVCYETPEVTYYCPGDTICCTPGSPTSTCCPEDHPLCIGDFCCPEGYPIICGEYCCTEESYCCGANCCKDEQSCCGEEQCCTEENPCCENESEKACCNKYAAACCGSGYGCVLPCESQFDAIGCIAVSFNGYVSYGNLTLHSLSLPKFLYRILRPDEVAKALLAKNPLADKTIISHVNCGSREYYKSQFISTTVSLEMARYYKTVGEKKGITGLRIAKIDVDQLPAGTTIYDLTTDQNRDKYIGLGPIVCKNFAKKSQEVLLQSTKPIPSEVIEDVTNDEDIRARNEL